MISHQLTRPSLLRRSAISLALGLALSCAIGVEARSETDYTPEAFGVGNAPIIDGLHAYKGKKVTLDSSAPLLTLDYGADVAGFPYFEVTALQGSSAQIELKYSEQFPALNSSTGDGPWYCHPRTFRGKCRRLG